MHDQHILLPDNANDPALVNLAKANAERWHLSYQSKKDKGIVLVQCYDRVELRNLDEPKMGPVYVDFASDALSWRRQHGGGKQEAIAKAVGVKGQSLPTVLDVTAGLGRDAFVLASLGCHVQMVERSPIVAALLQDGLERGALNVEIGSWLSQRMQFQQAPSYNVLCNWQGAEPDVVYLDPMYPHKRKSAAVKKEMKVFQMLLGADSDADTLLAPALQLAGKRVVVKRPDYAAPLNDQAPSMSIKTKKHRFDVYITHNQS
ncbi:class I SAM-dependent methyltransferase [Aestuariibacter salexigens]|uniref:class I SAM-dependent methyltransferase n=1 Tax=Aestuariibacter salexigens TaxID=226010 RepID=UPI00041D85D5|nr:class I SAM-dependent methyltransferase [Aestuariibacter salexigens]